MVRMKFHSKLVYDWKYIKAKVKAFNSEVNAIFWNDETPEKMYITFAYQQ